VIAQLPLPVSRPARGPALPQWPADPWPLFQQRVKGYAARYAALWESVEAATPRLGPVVPLPGKLKREAQADAQFEAIKTLLRQFPRSHEQREGWRAKLLNAGREIAGRTLGLPNAALELFFTRTGVEATRRFVREARAFDPGMSDENLLQALRNLWVIHSIQVLFEREPSVSPATFAYSMLYPWTDNRLDDPAVSSDAKLRFGQWLERRLCGSHPAPPDAHAAQVGRLVGMIEGHFPRAEFEEVYLSLRAIHHAQMASLQQQSTGDFPDGHALLHITLRKGGTSVLADACLVAGQLSESETDFMFGYGTVLQLLDDLQDVSADLANGHATLFAREAAAGFLDAVTARLWSFLRAALWSPGRFEAPRFQPVKTLIQESCKLLLLQAVARNCRLYTARFAAELESCSPFRFAFLRDREASLGAECRKLISSLRRRRQINAAFDLLS
jgi:hypothetical protein